ncbi:MAG: hypothetical protein ACRC26_10005, partial [Bacteroidales bacterium]
VTYQDNQVYDFIEENICNGATMYIEDCEVSDFSKFAHKVYVQQYRKSSDIRYTIINFNDPKKSHRCNPLTKIKDLKSARSFSDILLYSYNESWKEKYDENRDDFRTWVEVCSDYLAACLLFLRIYEEGRYLTLPHLVEFFTLEEYVILYLLNTYPETGELVKDMTNEYLRYSNSIHPCISMMFKNIEALNNKEMYWIMTGNDFSLDINNPDAPKILCCIDSNENMKKFTAMFFIQYNMLYTEFKKGEIAFVFNSDRLCHKFRDIAVGLKWSDIAILNAPANMNIKATIYNMDFLNPENEKIVTDQMIEDNYYQIKKDIKEIANAFADQC